MKTKLTLLSLAVAGLCAVPASLFSADPVPPTPPGGTAAPPAADKPAAKPDGERRGPGGPGGRMDPAERLKKMTETLGLTQEQQDKIKAIFESGREEFGKLRDVPEDQRREKMREAFKAQNDKILAVLTPEQQEKYKAAMAERLKQGGGPGGDRKPGEGRPKPGDAK
jgi:Spy/CpxP family protein refolding chaperone